MIFSYFLLIINILYNSSHAHEPIHAHGKNKTLVIFDNESQKQVLKYGDDSNPPIISDIDTLKVNNRDNSPNPLKDKRVAELIFPADRAFFATHEDPSVLYFLEKNHDKYTLLSTDSLLDAQGQHECPSAGIIKLESVTTDNHYIFAALKAHQGNFGDKGGGIGLVSYKSELVTTSSLESIESKDEKDQKDEKNESAPKTLMQYLSVFDTQTGTQKGNKALALDKDTPALTINGGIDFIQPNVVDMYWDPYLSCLYVALQIKTSDQADMTQGGRALLIGRVKEGRMTFDPIAPENAFSGDQLIIGATGPNQYVSLHKLSPMITSTFFNYIIIIGGNGKPEETNNKVHALPLVKKSLISNSLPVGSSDPEQGTLAKKNGGAQPCPLRNNRSSGITLTQPAQDSADMYICTDNAVRVGADVELPGPVKDIITVNDTVLVIVNTSTSSIIFRSQAIIDHTGYIAAWTPWQRHYVSNHTLLSFQPRNDIIAALVQKDSTTYAVEKIPFFALQRRDDTNKPLSGIIDLLNNEFPPEKGGIQGISGHTYRSDEHTEHTVLIATGDKKVALVKTGCIIDNASVNPVSTFTTQDICYTENGIIDPCQDPYTILVFQSEVLDDLGPICCADLINDGKEQWLVVGGSTGLAVLSTEDGSGLPLSDGHEKLPRCNAPMSFKKIGSQPFVQKIMHDDSFMYILSRNSIERIALNKNNFVYFQAPTLTLASSKNLGFFSDMLIGGDSMIVATKNTLLKTAQESTIKKAITSSEISWEKIDLPYNKNLKLTRLMLIPSTSNQDTLFEKSQLYVLAGCASQEFSSLYRFYGENGLFHPLPDYSSPEEPTAFLNYSSFRHIIATNGIIVIAAQNIKRNKKPLLTHDFLNPLWFRTRFHIRPTVTSINNPGTTSITSIIHEPCTGAWFVTGDFGVGISY